MRRLFQIQGVFILLLVTACVTVNIYFPAAELKRDAEKVVKRVYGIEGQEEQESQESAPGQSWLELLGPSVAHAQDYQSFSNSVTRGIEQQLGQVYKQLKPFYASGNVGLDQNGFATLRDKSGLNMQQIGSINRLISQDRSLKQQLYQEKAKAAQTPGKAGKVQAIYADIWKGYAASGTWIQDGGWRQK
ncbi:Protein of unknown function [Paucidesulfovibrio gracilis DSM 16080]|uniref:DUF1318 domain-containing protein n=1 Tax=Paucidesulfovibrio gracilis DSM 16080 TaxID=1121449 RepID=A0A1T4W912_9BACT|nr:DUF1318 domain-containing protein [Paucidesulfovibrio gracilis]SKA73687.1 Protein of unknown function [Paucidesulfovibrio gracilis DSM 16080]